VLLFCVHAAVPFANAAKQLLSGTHHGQEAIMWKAAHVCSQHMATQAEGFMI
jgi:hypothetical protein